MLPCRTRRPGGAQAADGDLFARAGWEPRDLRRARRGVRGTGDSHGGGRGKIQYGEGGGRRPENARLYHWAFTQALS